MSTTLIIFLILSFLSYSVSLWGAGFFQKRKLNDAHIQAAEFGSDTYYLTFVIITLISLMIFLGLNFYISGTTSVKLVNAPTQQPMSVPYTQIPQGSQYPQMSQGIPSMQMQQPRPSKVLY
jgi:energy-coupling factor transporter transmembrane protein EcfT